MKGPRRFDDADCEYSHRHRSATAHAADSASRRAAGPGFTSPAPNQRTNPHVPCGMALGQSMQGPSPTQREDEQGGIAHPETEIGATAIQARALNETGVNS